MRDRRVCLRLAVDWRREYMKLLYVFTTYIKVVSRCSREEAGAVVQKMVDCWEVEADLYTHPTTERTVNSIDIRD